MGQVREDMENVSENEKVDLLKKVVTILDRNDIKYYLVFGTLLGCVRDKKFIPWDSDIDIAVFDIKSIFKVEKELNDVGLLIEDKTRKGTYGNLTLTYDKLNERACMHIDICEFKYFHGSLSFKWLKNETLIARLSDLVYHLCHRKNVVKSGVLTIDHMKKIYRYINIVPSFIKKIIEKIAIEVNFLTTNKRVLIFPEIFPLFKEVEFYGMDVTIPYTYEQHLVLNYGEDWMTPDDKYSGGAQKVVGKIDGYNVIGDMNWLS